MDVITETVGTHAGKIALLELKIQRLEQRITIIENGKKEGPISATITNYITNRISLNIRKNVEKTNFEIQKFPETVLFGSVIHMEYIIL